MSRRGNSNYVHVTADVIRKTDKAVQVAIAGATHWLPLSQMAPGEAEKVAALVAKAAEGEVIEGVTLSITEWIAGEKGIDGDE